MNKRMLLPLFSWRKAICESNLPATARHSLITLSLWANEMGGSCYPTQKMIVEATGLSERTVRSALRQAVREGWLKRTARHFNDQRWRNYEYELVVPAKKGPATVAAPSQKDRQLTTEGPATERKKDRQPLPLNSYITPNNSQRPIEKKPVDKSKFLTGLKQVKEMLP